MTTRAAIYVRVSTQEQAQDGYSLAAQTQRLRAFCESQDWSIVDIYADEGFSAKDTNRPALQRLLSDIEARKLDVVLVWRLDRLSRSVMDLHGMLRTFDKYSVGFKSSTEVFDTTTAIGRLFITIVAAMAQWERENIGERVRMGLEQMTLEGKHAVSYAPFGYVKVDGKLIVHARHADIVREMYQRFISGHGIHRLRMWLRTVTDKKWDTMGVTYVLENPVYIGKVRWGHRGSGQTLIADGDHDPIIDEATWETAQEIRARNKTFAPGRAGTGRFPFGGLVFCSKCGSRMVGYEAGGKWSKLYYRCVGVVKKECDARLVRADALEANVLGYLRGMDFLPAQDKAPSLAPLSVVTRDIERERAALAIRKKRLWDAYEVGGDLAELRERLERVREEEAALEQVDTATVAIDEHEWQKRMREMITHIVDGWDSFDNLTKKELMRGIIERVDAEKEDILITLRVLA